MKISKLNLFSIGLFICLPAFSQEYKPSIDKNAADTVGFYDKKTSIQDNKKKPISQEDKVYLSYIKTVDVEKAKPFGSAALITEPKYYQNPPYSQKELESWLKNTYDPKRYYAVGLSRAKNYKSATNPAKGFEKTPLVSFVNDLRRLLPYFAPDGVGKLWNDERVKPYNSPKDKFFGLNVGTFGMLTKYKLTSNQLVVLNTGFAFPEPPKMNYRALRPFYGTEPIYSVGVFFPYLTKSTCITAKDISLTYQVETPDVNYAKLSNKDLSGDARADIAKTATPYTIYDADGHSYKFFIDDATSCVRQVELR
jgi:hypothetical protein